MGPILADDVLRLLLEAAVSAPFGDNAQPWRLRPDRAARRLDVLLAEDEAAMRPPPDLRARRRIPGRPLAEPTRL